MPASRIEQRGGMMNACHIVNLNAVFCDTTRVGRPRIQRKATMHHNGSRLRLRVAAVAALSAMALSGCANGDGAEPGTVIDGGDVVLLTDDDTGCLDPHQVQLRDVLQWQRSTIDSLLYEDETGALRPWLASAWEVNGDATEFTFTLRDDVMFADGSVLDAETVQANFDALRAMPEATVAAPYLATYVETMIVDEHTATIVFDEPNAQFLFGVSTPNLGLYSKASAGLSANERCQGEAAASGPFAVDTYTQNEQVVLQANPDYAWGPDALPNAGAAHIDTLTVNVVPDATSIGGAALAGDADIVLAVNDEDVPRLEDAGWVNGPQPEPALSAGWIIRLGSGIAGTDEAVRRALLVGVDREGLQGAMLSRMDPATGLLNSAHPYHVDQRDALTYDPDAAIEILEEAGWEPGADGIRERDGERLSIETIFYTPGSQEVLELARQQLEEIGIELVLVPVTANEESALRAEGDFEMRLSWFTGPDPVVMANVFNETNPPQEVQDLIAAQLAETDFDARSVLVTDLMDYTLEHALLVPLWEQNNTPFWGPTVTGVTRDVAGLIMMTQIEVVV